MNIQRVYLIHDYLYASVSLIPAESLDGKDIPSERYIIVSEPIVECSAMGIMMYQTEDEAREQLECIEGFFPASQK